MKSWNPLPPKKVNVVVDTWSQRTHLSQLEAKIIDHSRLCEEFNNLNLRIVANTKVIEMEVYSTLL
jgi:hypothetical protein